MASNSNNQFAFQNPFGQSAQDFYSAFSQQQVPTVDFNQFFAAQRRNLEAFAQANQVLVEGAQEISRRSADIMRDSVEEGLKAAKDMFTGNAPETNAAKQSEFARNNLQKTFTTMREIGELATKTQYEAFEVLNKRASETVQEATSFAGQAAQQNKRKAS